MSNGPLESKSIGCPRFVVRSISQPILEQVNFPVEDHSGSHPATRGRVPDNVRFAVADNDGGLVAKLFEKSSTTCAITPSESCPSSLLHPFECSRKNFPRPLVNSQSEDCHE